MQYTPRVPQVQPLAAAVELIFCVDEYSPEHQIERLVPTGRVNLVFELDGRPRHVFDNETQEPQGEFRGAWLSGVHSNYILIGETLPESRVAAVQFVPGRARSLIPRDLSEFNDRVVPAVEVFGESVLELRERLLELDAPAVNRAIEQWLLDRHDAASTPPPVVCDVVRRMLAQPEDVPLTELVEADGSVSYKHFVELFKRHVGPNPKRMQRILRFAQVFERIHGQEQVDWVQLSLDLGYSDQAHFIRDFASFSGYRPQRFVKDGHERLNFFPEESV